MTRARTLFADAALLDEGVTPNVRIGIDATGTIAAVQPHAVPLPDDERVSGLAVPGIANLHSHAFQRAMAGLAERAGPEGDNFWRWREVMYRFLAVLSPDDVQAIAAQLYAECLLHGYTAVAEFHYLHNAPDGAPYSNPAELSERILAAAAEAGIGLTLLPVLYRHGGFAGAPPVAGQRRFVLSVDAFAGLCAGLAGKTRLGVAPHSLRAVTPEELDAAVAIAAGLGPDTPMHIHAAEQVREVEDCLAWSRVPPVQWLLDRVPVGPGWCLIHATHMTPNETARLAASGAVAGLCQTTEANLGDGIFPLRAFLGGGGQFGIGSDSNVSTSPVEELRWLEYVRRLETRARNVSETRQGASVAAGLLRRAAFGGAQALGRPAGAIAPGLAADLVALDTEHPALVGRQGDAALDAWLFCGNATPVRHVLVEGAWVVRDGAHVRAVSIAAAFRATMRRLAEAA
jgi:formimidoylglutamate deiminase